MDLRTRLNELKDERRLTNQQISDGSGVPLGTVSSIFSGQTTRPAFQDVVDILDYFGVSVDDFPGRTPKPKPEPTATVKHHRSISFVNISEETKALARNAIREVYESEAYKTIEKSLRSWKRLASFETTFIVAVLLWDVTHPTMGYIQYSVTTTPAIQGLIDWIRRV